jgi:hypothetical protein
MGSGRGTRISALRTGRALPPSPKEVSWYLFLLEAELTSGPGLGQLKKNPVIPNP